MQSGWMVGRASRRAGVWTGGRAVRRAGGRAGRPGHLDIRYVALVQIPMCARYVIISRADDLQWRGELKCFLIPVEFISVGNIKV